MSKHHFGAILLAMVLALAAIPGSVIAAGSASTTQALSAQTLQKFQREAARIRAEMAPGKRHAGLDESEMQTIERTLNELQYLFESAGSVDAMNPPQKTKLASLQERVNAILSASVDTDATANPTEELVCERIKAAGSNRYQRICMTAHERERRQEEARDRLNRR